MIVRLKAVIYKPKACLSTKHRLRPSPFSYKPKPKKVAQALSDHQWQVAMNLEYIALFNNKTWTLVSYVPSMQVVDNKWVLEPSIRLMV